MQRLAFWGLIALALTFLAPTGAQAQATRTWVSGVGDDANPCSRTAPCKTFAGAISKTAPGGEIDALDPGGFGALTITKSITIDGGGGQVASVLVAGTNGIVVAAGATDVVILRNLRFDGLLGNGSNSGNAGINGIRFISGAALSVENCDIFGFNNFGIDVENGQAANFYVTNSTLINNGLPNSGGGIYISSFGGGTKAAISGLKVENSTVGLKVDGNNSASPTQVNISNSMLAMSTKAGMGVSTTNGPVTVVADHLVSTNNKTVGIQAIGAGATVFLGNSVITGNTTGVLTQTSGQILSMKNNMINGNATDGTPLPAAPGPQN